MFLAILCFVLNPPDSLIFFKQGCYCTLLQFHTEQKIDHDKGQEDKKWQILTSIKLYYDTVNL